MLGVCLRHAARHRGMARASHSPLYRYAAPLACAAWAGSARVVLSYIPAAIGAGSIQASVLRAYVLIGTLLSTCSTDWSNALHPSTSVVSIMP